MKTILSVEGMHCGACVAKVAAALQSSSGVQRALVTLSPPRAELESVAPLDVASLNAAAQRAGNYAILPVTGSAPSAVKEDSSLAQPQSSLYPLALIIAYILGVVSLTTLVREHGNLRTFLNDFMAGFFLVFAFFKLLDVRGFADAYQSYDIVAKRIRPWALVYPFVELALGLAFLTRWQPLATNAITLILMLVGSIGVLSALLNKRHIRCACLGTALNLPMTTVTLIEDLGMAAMSVVMILWIMHG